MNDTERLIAFARTVIRYVVFNGYSMDGDDVQDMGVKYGLLRSEPYDPAIHRNISHAEYLDPGDEIFVFDGPLAEEPQP